MKLPVKQIFFGSDIALTFYDMVDVLSVEITCLCRVLISRDDDFHFYLGFK